MSESEFNAVLLIKLGVVAAIYIGLPLKHAIVVSLVLIICYRYIIATFLGLNVMGAMDLNTFSTND